MMGGGVVVSVCMTSFNGEKFIKKQILSILNQLSNTDELIISDDESTDTTLEIINSINDARIKLVHHKPDNSDLDKILGGYRVVADNCANALQYVRGDIVFLADQDDLWADNRVYRMCKALEENDLVMCNYMLINDNDELISQLPIYVRSPISSSFIYNIVKSRFMLCCIAFKTELLHYILPLPANLMSMDQWIGGLATLKGRVAFLSDVYHLYRRHGGNVSCTSEKSKNPLHIKIFFRLSMFFKILRRTYLRNHNN